MLHDDGTLVAEFQDDDVLVQVDEGSTPSDSVRSVLFVNSISVADHFSAGFLVRRRRD